jgi:hypothetical protein
MPVAARPKAWVCGRSLAEIEGPIPTGGVDVYLLWVLCVVRGRSLRRADHSSRGVLPSMVRRCVWSRNLGSNPTGGMDVCLFWLLCVVRERYLRRADHSSREVLRSVIVIVWDLETSWVRKAWPSGGCRAKIKQILRVVRCISHLTDNTSPPIRKTVYGNNCYSFIRKI